MKTELLALIDAERRQSGSPIREDSIAREYSGDRSECRIIYSRCGAGDLPGIIRNEVAMAQAGPYILEWNGRRGVEKEASQLAAILRGTPDKIRIHVAYDGGEAVGCARTHFTNSGELAELCGARTKTTHRRRGVFTSLAARSLESARIRGCKFLIADALPTSEPILRKKGFQIVTDTQPFVFRPMPTMTGAIQP